jgi:chromosome segregation ATPase
MSYGYEANYPIELLRSYRIAHARVSVIEPFEAALRENTPLTSINDPDALVEYLNQNNLKGEMVLDELKRVSKEKETFKQKLEEAEKSARQAWDEVKKMREEKVVGEVKLSESNNAEIEKGSPLVAGQPPKQPEGPGIKDDTEQTIRSPSISAILRSPSIPGISLFSPKVRRPQEPASQPESEEFFSYDAEVPQVEDKPKEAEEDVIELQQQVKNLRDDLSVARESTQSMVQTLEDATLELNGLREQKDKIESELTKQRLDSQSEMNNLRSELEAVDGKMRMLESKDSSEDAERSKLRDDHLKEAEAKLEKMAQLAKEHDQIMSSVVTLQAHVDKLQSELLQATAEKEQNIKRADTLNGLLKSLRGQLSKAETNTTALVSERDSLAKNVQSLQLSLDIMELELKKKQPNSEKETGSADAASPKLEVTPDFKAAGESTVAKKKNKKKKKGGKAGTEQEMEPPETPTEATATNSATLAETKTSTSEDTILKLQVELTNLGNHLREKDAAIEKLHGKLKNGEDMQEEIDSLRDDLVNVAQEHVAAKDKIKDLLAKKGVLEKSVSELEKEIADLRSTNANNRAGSAQAQKDLLDQFEDLKVKATALQTDLSVAQQLASSRFKDLTDLRSILQKAQPELAALRKESQDIKAIKEELSNKTSELQKAEVRYSTLKAELSELKRAMESKEADAKALAHRLSQETASRQQAESTGTKATQDLQRSETDRKQIAQSLEKASKELIKSKEDLNTHRVRIRVLEDSLSKLQRDSEMLKEEMELKIAQHASAESLMSSMRDQTTEMVMQTKESRDRCETLEEEIADAHRLLGERSREAQTMRTLLTEVEGRADSRIREMKDRLDTAVEERDRAEDEASTASRRRARELEEMRNKLRDAERNLKRAEDDKEVLEVAQRDWKKRREELEQRSESSGHEVEDIRKAMSALRDTLDESEKQVRELEKQKAELRRSVEDTQQRLDKLQKTNKVCVCLFRDTNFPQGMQRASSADQSQAMSEDLKNMQASKARIQEAQAASPRSSLDTVPTRARVGSASTTKTTSLSVPAAANGQASPSMDYVYLKNILLQFLEQKNKKLQIQLIPVLGMLLHFDR